MKSLNDIDDYLNVSTKVALEQFQTEISTVENKDFRRGFRTGVLFSYLHTKSHIGTIDHASTEQPTD